MTSTPYQTVDQLGKPGVYIFGPISIPLANIAAGHIVAGVKPGHNGKILGIGAFPTTVATTASKAATLTPTISGTAVSAPAVTLTSANMGTLGAAATETDATVTAAPTFTSTDTIGIDASAVTTFVEGTGAIYMIIQDTDNT